MNIFSNKTVKQLKKNASIVFRNPDTKNLQTISIEDFLKSNEIQPLLGSDTTITGNNTSSEVQNPGAGQDSYVLSWNNSTERYELIPITDESFRQTEIEQSTVDYFVDNTVATTGDGLTALTPFKTMAEARAAIIAGSSGLVYVFAGRYTENIELATLSLSENTITWYLETGVDLNWTSRLTNDPGSQFFEAPLLSIKGNGRIQVVMAGPMIDTTDSFFSIISIEAHRFRFIATAGSVEPIVLDASFSDDSLELSIKEDVSGNTGQFGWASPTNVTNSDYFITSKNTNASKAVDSISLRNVNEGSGQFDLETGGLFFSAAADAIPQCNFKQFTRINQTTGQTECIRFEGDILDFQCGQDDGLMGNGNLRAIGTGTNDVRIVNQLSSTVTFASEIQVVGGNLTLENNKWVNTITRYIWAENGILTIKNCDIRGSATELVSTTTTGSILQIRDSFVLTDTGSAIELYSTTRNDIINTVVISTDGVAIACIGSSIIGGADCTFSNTIGNKALANVNDPATGYNSNVLFDNLT